MYLIETSHCLLRSNLYNLHKEKTLIKLNHKKSFHTKNKQHKKSLIESRQIQ